MWLYIAQGIGYGFAAGAQPGPFQTYLISQSLARGWKQVLPAALAPFLSDGPIIALCLLVLSQVPVWVQRFLYIAGGLFVVYLAFGAWQAWKNFDPSLPLPGAGARQSILKAALTNALSPGPYLFWSLVTGPILLEGWRNNPVNGFGFLAGFYAAFLSSLAAIILVFGISSKLGPRLNRALLGISALALFCFGSFQIGKGLIF